MKRVALLVIAGVVAAGFLVSLSPVSGHTEGRAGKQVSEQASPIFGVKIPAGYRDWKVIAADNLLVPGKFDQLRVQLGNDIAIKAFREGTLPFPDGAIIAAIHWNRVPSESNDKVLAGEFPALNPWLSGLPRMFSSWSRIQRSTPRRLAGGSLTLRAQNRPTRGCTRLASPATRLRKTATTSSLVTHLSAEN